MRVPRSILLATCSFKEILYHTIFRLQSKCLIISLVLPISGDPSFSFSLFTFVAVLFSGCQAPGKTALTDLFIGTLLPALKCIKFVFETLQHCGNNVIPVLHTSVALPAVMCAQVSALPGSEPVAVPPIFLYVGAACALKGRFCQEGKHEIGWHEQNTCRWKE